MIKDINMKLGVNIHLSYLYIFLYVSNFTNIVFIYYSNNDNILWSFIVSFIFYKIMIFRI